MNEKSGTFFKGLLSTFAPDTGKELVMLASTQDQHLLEKCFYPEQLFLKKEWWSEIHPSWFDSLPKTTDALKTLFLSKDVSVFQRAFFSAYFKKELQGDTILPIEHLPPSPLNVLLDLQKEHFYHIVDLLGIYDLAFEIKKIISKPVLVKIEQALSPKQREFLKFAATQTAKWIPPRLQLEKWDGDKKKLYLLLHKRGLYRLGKAIALEGASFQWHLVHKVEKKRGEFLMSIGKKEDPSLVSFFKGQVVQLLKQVAL